MTQVFISYSRRDLDFVEQLAADLKAAGLDVWYDLSGLEGGARWRIEIEKAIRASQYVLVVLSPDSVASEWVEEERLFASKLKKKIIPLFYRQCDLPLGYYTRHYVDIRGADYKRNFGEILRAINVKKLDSEIKSGGLSQSWISRLIDVFRGSMQILRQQVESTTSRYPVPTINPLPENIYGKIAFHKGKDYIIANTDGTNEFVMAKANWSINSPRIAPGGKAVVFSAAYEDQQDSIYVIDRDGSSLKRLTGPSDAKQDWYASWSPDGTKLIFARAYSVTNDIFVMDNNGKDQKNLTRPFGKKSLNYFSEFPWSPDGKRIVFSSSRDENLNIYTMDNNGENIQRITSNSDKQDYGAVWAPDKNTIAFVSTPGVDGETDIFTLDMGSTEAKPINITNSPSHDTNPVWSPDGTQILFVSDREGNRELYIMNNDGSNVQRITRTAEPKDNPSWLR